MKEYKNGFTLIEMMVVIAIVAIMSAIVVLNISAPTYATFMANAKKIATTLSILSDEAVYTNSVVACDINSQGFNCQSYKNGNWKSLNLHNIVSWTWPKNYTVKDVYINDLPMKQGEQIKFFASGEQQPTSIKVTNGRYTTWIDGDINGIFKVNN